MCYHLHIMSRISKGKSVVAIGTFDGVHRGHQVILALLNEIAMKQGLQRVAYAFVFPPRLAVRGEERGLLLPEEAKIKLLKRYVDRVERVNFENVSSIAPDQFVRKALLGDLRAQAIVVGENFRFGRDRAGDVALIREICKEESVSVVAVPPLVVDASPVSSTRIRRLISAGMIEEAGLLLGRPPLLVGEIVHGDRLGRDLGHPTANLSIDAQILLPKDGIYLAHAFWNGGKSPGLLYVGTRPTVNGTDRRCEVHLFAETSATDMNKPTIFDDLYGKILEIQILRRLRDDRSFPSLVKLQRQMERDVERARTLLATFDWPQERIVT